MLRRRWQRRAGDRLRACRDALYGWTAQRLVVKQAALGLPSYLYLFDHGYPSADAAGLKGFHGSGLPFVFGTLAQTPPHWPKIPATDSEAALSAAMLGYWSSCDSEYMRSVSTRQAHAGYRGRGQADYGLHFQ